MFKAQYPQRIICLTEEGTEILYAINQQHRLVGISGFTRRPKQARKEKPKVSNFIDANFDAILELKPDLVIGYSDLQRDIASELIKNGINVFIFNHRSIDETLSMILQFCSLIGNELEGKELVQNYILNLNNALEMSKSFPFRPKVFFEEWNDPLISSIQWVSELVEICGGDLIFPELAKESMAKDRIVHPDLVIDKNPDIIIGSWCGKKFKPEKVKARKGWEEISAVKNNHLYEIKSEIILQPGPAALTDGILQIQSIISGFFHT
ncbi:ABC transporter substrate-binding protein [Moheibacter sediminis]|uniref:Iron complex transport system substrate-binding protein n=1 Tax=Moheibacter sediminis TaxID=1434700 RepID=A0A1W2B067_9FLAO|nr:ABC transporter substrate-binding protein [Moheibacter sediminis]SMC66339.1 iron complex transport system substrate-binding protein [Moheibacter sediminis]